ncbi:MAG: hypothetical protein ACE5PV_06340, partial [Candidatus Poribacteria bacterium]
MLFQISFWAMATMTSVIVNAMDQSRTDNSNDKAQSRKPQIEKLGTIDCDMVETTPIVFHGRLYRFE